MKKNWVLITTCTIIYIAFITIISYFIIIPGINKLKEANNIKDLSYEEKTKIIDEINQKYIVLENETIDKYKPSIEEVNSKYDKLKKEIEEKYDKEETTIKEKYDKEETKINNDINDVSVAENKEFFANGLSKKYYELRDKWSKLQEQKSELSSREKEEIRNNESLEKTELNTNESSRKNELKTIENNKTSELTRLSQNKENELNSINNQNTNKNSIRNNGIFKISIGIAIILIPLLYIISIFNKLTHLSNSIQEKWSQVDVLLKQRADLIPNIVSSIKGASTHEKSTLTNVTKARNQVVKAATKEEEIEANKNLSTVINRLFILQEDYPELKTNTNFMNLQHDLKELEDNISYSRKIYNKEVLKYKNKLEMFPSNVVANIFSFQPEPFFEIDEEDKENPNINFE